MRWCGVFLPVQLMHLDIRCRPFEGLSCSASRRTVEVRLGNSFDSAPLNILAPHTTRPQYQSSDAVCEAYCNRTSNAAEKVHDWGFVNNDKVLTAKQLYAAIAEPSQKGLPPA